MYHILGFSLAILDHVSRGLYSASPRGKSDDPHGRHHGLGSTGTEMRTKTAVVTGCLGAIGKATCEELGKIGFAVTGIDKAAQGAGHAGRYFSCDLADARATLAMLHQIGAESREIDLLVNNAGAYEPKGFFELTVADFDTTMAVNARAIFILSQEIARWMIAAGRGGSIVNIASIAGKLGSPIIPYGASKAAAIGLTKSMARVLAPHGIRVNAIAPGTIESPMSARVAPTQMERQMASVPMARMGVPAEIAGVVAFLAQDASSYMTGSILDVNGGWPC
jgi:NAD(P)-dependent dehydrogenase (short-subunit alcohol dehydrogenase family)